MRSGEDAREHACGSMHEAWGHWWGTSPLVARKLVEGFLGASPSSLLQKLKNDLRVLLPLPWTGWTSIVRRDLLDSLARGHVKGLPTWREVLPQMESNGGLKCPSIKHPFMFVGTQ